MSDRNYDFCDDPLNELVAADARVEELENELAEAQSKILCWISVEERLPEHDHIGNPVGVLACLPDGEVCIGFCDNDEYGVRWHCQSTKKPTHWMKLPEPPEVT